MFTCKFLYLCTGYYDYAAGYTPDWPGLAEYGGTLVHPQKWPDGLDYSGKKVLVIGSGATAVTLVPAMAETAEHVTMLQRSPTYVVTMPSQDGSRISFASCCQRKRRICSRGGRTSFGRCCFMRYRESSRVHEAADRKGRKG